MQFCWNTNQSYQISVVFPSAATSVAYLWHHLMINQVTVGCWEPHQWQRKSCRVHNSMDTSACAAPCEVGGKWTGNVHWVRGSVSCHQSCPWLYLGTYWKHWPADISTYTTGVLLRLIWDPLEGLVRSGSQEYRSVNAILPLFHLIPSNVLVQRPPSHLIWNKWTSTKTRSVALLNDVHFTRDCPVSLGLHFECLVSKVHASALLCTWNHTNLYYVHNNNYPIQFDCFNSLLKLWRHRNGFGVHRNLCLECIAANYKMTNVGRNKTYGFLPITYGWTEKWRYKIYILLNTPMLWIRPTWVYGADDGVCISVLAIAPVPVD